MADLQGLISFAGINQVVSWSFGFTHGISPSVCTVEILPQGYPIRDSGTIRMSFDGAVQEFPDCRIDKGATQRNGEGLVWRLEIMDRRWRWKFGEVYGEYNRIDDTLPSLKGNPQQILATSERTPQQLASILLDAMGESGYDVSSLPNDSRPHVEWVGANPARALADLCDSFGCFVVLGLDNKVRLMPQGVGNTLPDLPTIAEDSATSDPADVPGLIRVIGGETIVQALLPLEAVALDTDGKIKTLEQISYRPTSGGFAYTGRDCGTIRGNQDALEKAWASLFKWYRVRITPSSPLVIPVFDVGTVYQLADILPLSDQLLDTVTDNIDGRKKAKSARVVGYYAFDPLTETTNSTRERNYECDVRFTLDGDRGIVMFEDMVRYYNGSTTSGYSAAQLWLECTFNVRHMTTGAKHRYNYLGSVNGGKPGLIDIVDRVADGDEDGELVLRLKEIPSAQDNVQKAFDSNIDTDGLNNRGRYYAENRAKRYQAVNPADRTYNGLVFVPIDGAIQQVTWTGGDSGCRTQAARNTETSPYLVPYQRRRMLERTAQIVVGETSRSSRVTRSSNRRVINQ